MRILRIDKISTINPERASIFSYNGNPDDIAVNVADGCHAWIYAQINVSFQIPIADMERSVHRNRISLDGNLPYLAFEDNPGLLYVTGSLR